MCRKLFRGQLSLDQNARTKKTSKFRAARQTLALEWHLSINICPSKLRTVNKYHWKVSHKEHVRLVQGKIADFELQLDSPLAQLWPGNCPLKIRVIICTL